MASSLFSEQEVQLQDKKVNTYGERLSFESEAIRHAFFHPNLKILELKFKSKNPVTPEKTYVYFNVPLNLFTEFANASSKGKFFNSHIRGKFGEKLLAED